MTERLDPIILSPDDDRDYTRGWFSNLVASVSDLPKKHEIDVWEVDDQLNHGSCLANAVTSAIEIYLKKAGKPQSLSRMYTYMWIRALSKKHKTDSGGFPRDMCKAVSKFGHVPESMYPYAADNLYRTPDVDVIAEGLTNDDWEYERIPVPGMYATTKDYTAVNTIIKSYIAQDIPVLLTLDLDSEFSPAATGPWQTHSWRKRAATPDVVKRGLHETLIVGYDDTWDTTTETGKRFKVLNSWGSEWGDQGIFGLQYRPDKSQVWQSKIIKELWVLKPKV